MVELAPGTFAAAAPRDNPERRLAQAKQSRPDLIRRLGGQRERSEIVVAASGWSWRRTGFAPPDLGPAPTCMSTTLDSLTVTQLRLAVAVCDRFEAAWRTGGRPD